MWPPSASAEAKPRHCSSRLSINPIRIQAAPEIERAFLEEWKKGTPHQATPLPMDLHQLPWFERSLFRMLHRQFTELWVPGLATGVSVARTMKKQFGIVRSKVKIKRKPR